MDSDETPSAPLPRRRRRWPWIALGGLALLVVIAAVAIPRLVDVERYREQVEEALRSATGWDAELGSMDLSLLGGVALAVSPAKLTEPGGGSKIEIVRIDVRASLLPLLRGELKVRSIDFIEPDMVAVRQSVKKGWVIPIPMMPPETDLPAKGQSPRIKVTVDELRVRSGRLVLEDRVKTPPLKMEITGLQLEITPRGGGVSGRGELVSGGELSWEGTLKKGLSFEVDAVPTEMLHSWVDRGLLHGGGRLDGTIDVSFPFAVRGQLVATGITLLSGKEPLDRAEVTFDVTSEGPDWTLASLRLVAGAVEARGSGSLLPALDLAVEVPPTALEAVLAVSRSVLPLPLDVTPPGRVEARLEVDRPRGGALSYQANGRISAKTLVVDPMLPPARDIEAAFLLDRKGALRVEILKGEAGGGPLRGVARLDRVSPPGRLGFDGGLTDAVLGQLLDGFVPGSAERIVGPTGLDAKLGVDLSAPTIDARALGGRLDVDSRQVSLPGWNLESALMSKLGGKLGALAESRGLGGGEGGDEGPLVDDLKLSVDLDQWPWRLEKVVLATGALRARGDGTFDPAAGKVDLGLTALLDEGRTRKLVEKNRALRALVDRKGRLAVGLRVRGPMMKPAVTVELDDLMKRGLEAEADDAVKGLLKGLVDR